MTATTYSWQIITDGLTDTASPALASTMESARKNLLTCQEMAYNSATHSPTESHDHDGANSARVFPPSPNLVVRYQFNDETNGREAVYSENVSFGEDNRDNAGALFRTSGDYVLTYAGGAGSQFAGPAAWGTRAIVVCSVFVRAVSPVSSGTLSFGLSDRLTDTFLTDCRADITASLITQSWQRFWAVCDTDTSGAGLGTISTALTMLIRCTGTFDNDLRVDCANATLGRNLTWMWAPSNSVGSPSSGAYDVFLTDMSKNIPIFDYRVSMRDAVKIAAV